MKQQPDSKGELRAAFTMHFLENAKRDIEPQSTVASVLTRVTLAVIFMYLTVISYQMMGTVGPVFVSVMFLISYFLPALYRALMARRRSSAARKSEHDMGHQPHHTS